VCAGVSLSPTTWKMRGGVRESITGKFGGESRSGGVGNRQGTGKGFPMQGRMGEEA
jgi:hypothetical protein